MVKKDSVVELKLHNLLTLASRCNAVHGHVAEVGVHRGRSALTIREALPHHPFLAFESFHGLEDLGANDLLRANASDRGHAPGDFAIESSVERATVVSRLEESNIDLRIGRFEVTSKQCKEMVFSFVHIDVDTYASTLFALSFFATRMAPRGLVVCDDFGWVATPGVQMAVEEVLATHSELTMEVSGTYQAVLYLAAPEATTHQ